MPSQQILKYDDSIPYNRVRFLNQKKEGCPEYDT